ncbi:MAG: hypothetical protein ACNA8W_25655, partial [Bradymonadaceae bacterium]
ERFTDTMNIASNTCGNTQAGAGPEAFYRISVPPNHTVKASLDVLASFGSNNNPILFAIEDCNDAEGSCVAGDYNTSSAEVAFFSEQGGTFTLVADSRYVDRLSQFILSVDMEEAECVPGHAYCDGTMERTCSEIGFYDDFDCPYGCAAGVCLAPTNNTCEGAFDLSGGGQVEAVLNDFYTNEYEAADPSCTGSYAGTAAEAVFYVDAQKNELITARLTSSFNYKVLWMTDDCSSSTPVCLDGASSVTGSTAVNIEHRALEDGRYYIFVDRREGTANNRNFNLTVEVFPPICEPFEIACLDSDTLGYCAHDGSEFISQSCTGGCANAACAEPEGDICPDPIVVTASGTYSGDWADFNDRHDPAYSACTGFDARGPDQVFAVELGAGQTLTATLANVGEAQNDLSLYAVTDCLEVAATCLAGSDQYGDVAESISYTASEAMTVYVVADSWTENAAGEFQLSIDVQ